MSGLVICALVVAGCAVPLLAWLVSGEASAGREVDDLIYPRPTATMSDKEPTP